MDNPYSTPNSELGENNKTSSLGKWLAILAVILAGVYLLWGAYVYKHWKFVFYAMPYLVAGIALFANRNWSQYIFYLIVLFNTGWWIYEIINTDWKFFGFQNSIISLIPGLIFVLINISVATIVYKQFHYSK